MCSNTLRNLDLHFSGDLFLTEYNSCHGTASCATFFPSTKIPMYLDLSSAPYLNNLTIRTKLFARNVVKPYKYICAFPAIIQLLQTTPNIKKLTLKFLIVWYVSKCFRYDRLVLFHLVFVPFLK